jgi:hypothetical protein
MASKKTKAKGAGAQWSVLTAAEARARLVERQDLPREFKQLATYALRRDEGVLWCAGAWSRPKTMPADLSRIALVVVDGPLVTTGSLSLRYGDIVGGGFVARDDAAFLFLGEFKARDIFTVPDVLGLFPQGATIERIASFEGADGHILIAHHLHAPIVVSGVSHSGATLAKDTEVRIGAYARQIFGLPKRGTPAFDSLEELMPFLADQVDDVDSWELLEGLKGRKLPAKFELPALPRPTRTPPAAAKKKPKAKRAAAPKAKAKAKAKARARAR